MIPLAVLYSFVSNMIYSPTPLQVTTTPRPPHNTTAIITGANTGIGFETARSLAIDYHCHVIVACRSAEKGQAAVQRIVKEDPASHVQFMQLDLMNFTSIQEFVQELVSSYSKIDILINNAGRNSDDDNSGWNSLFQTNFVGHYYLTRLLLQQQLFNTSHQKARVVHLSSVMHHFAPYENQWTDTTFWKQVARPNTTSDIIIRDRYALSKLASILFSVQLNLLNGDQLQSIAVNPGAV